MHGDRALSAAALLPYLEAAAQRREYIGAQNTAYVGLTPLAEDLAERLGISAKSVKRQIIRFGRPGATVNRFTADAWTVALGLHPALVWGEAWWSLPDVVNRREYRRLSDARRRGSRLEAVAVGEGG